MIAPILARDDLEDFEELGDLLPDSVWDYLEMQTAGIPVLSKLVSGARGVDDVAETVQEVLPSPGQVVLGAAKVGASVARNTPAVVQSVPSAIVAAAPAVSNAIVATANEAVDSTRRIAKWTPYVLAGIGALLIWRIVR
jgi:hypothetical protein